MAMENDGILSETLEQPVELDGQAGGADGETPVPETLLPRPEPEGFVPPVEKDTEDGGAPLPSEDGVGAEDADTGGPPAEEQGSAGAAPDAPAADPPAEGAGGAETAVAEEKPKRKRAAPRKKAAPKEDDPPPPLEDAAPAEEQEDQDQDEAEHIGQDSVTVVADPAAPSSGHAPAPLIQPPATPRAAPGKPGAPVVRRRALEGLDLREMDRYLSEEQRQEWNDIYASYRSKTVLSGHIMGVDRDEFKVKNRETGEEELQRMHTVIVIPYRVKVLIPESEMWMPGDERPGHVLRNMVGAKIDFSVLDLDREGECAIGSRRMGMAARRHLFAAVKGGHKEGEMLSCQVLAVGPKRCLVDCNGYDLNLSQRDLTYTAVADLRERYHPGQELPCVLKEYSHKEEKLAVSVKEVNPNPFAGADQRHPINSRRQAVISGKYGGGVFCTLPDDTTCLCLYSTQHSDSDFHIGDTVIIAIKQYDYKRQLIYGRILARW